MIKKVWIGLAVIALLGGCVRLGSHRSEPKLPESAGLFPKDTLFYAGTRSPVKMAAVLAEMDIEQILQEDAGWTEEESRAVGDWMRSLRGVHVGFNTFTLVPFVVNAAVVLEGPFDRTLAEILGGITQYPVQRIADYRNVSVRRMQIPLRAKFSLDLYMTDPIEDRLAVAFSKRALTDLIDRMLDGGPSLRDHPDFSAMASLQEMRGADTLSYVNLQAYLNMLYEWTRTVPYPPVKPLVDLFWTELRLDDYECIVSGEQVMKQAQYSCLQLNPANPLAVQLADGEPLRLPHIPADSSQLFFCRLADPSIASGQMIHGMVRVERGISGVLGDEAGRRLRAGLQEIAAAAAGQPGMGELFTGDLGMWQRHASVAGGKPAFCIYVGIKDAGAVREKIRLISNIDIVETDGIIFSRTVPNLVWSVQKEALLIANDSDFLRASLAKDAASLTESEEFIALRKGLPETSAVLQYVNYENGIPVQNAGKLAPAVLPLLADLFKGCRRMSVSYAAEGRLHTHSVWQREEARQLLKTVLRGFFSAVKEVPIPEEPEFPLAADEALRQSIQLLSAGRQMDAEELAGKAVRKYQNDAELLFANAVLERSRWSNRAAHFFFSKVIEQAPGSDLARASGLCLELDRGKSKEKLNELAAVSDANPEHIYLLWLSAIQCREQGQKAEATPDFKTYAGKLGRERYEKLMERFTVGPVLLHQTYANILSEYLADYETALKHRYMAVSLEAKGWTLQGLANTLKDVGRYEEACAVWARTVRVAPDEPDYWAQWGWTLRKMERYDQAVEKYLEAYRLNTKSGDLPYTIGWCFEKLNRYEEMAKYYRIAAEAGDLNGVHALGWCYHNGKGIEKDPSEALKWYLMAAGRGMDRSQFEVGYCYHMGSGVEQNFAKAAEWYQRAAEQGHLRAKINLGLLYADGKGVNKDPAKAMSLYTEVLHSDPNHAHAMNNYAWLLATCSTESLRDYPKAVKLAEQSVALDEQQYSLNTLSVAYDRNSQYAKAIEAQKRLIAFRQKNHPGKPVPEAMQKRLEMFEGKLEEQRAAVSLYED